MKPALMKLSAAVFGAALLAGCASMGVKAHKGAVVDPQLASAIQPGVDNKASVEKTLGRPSFTGQFTPNDWYYVSRDTNQFAFRNPRVKQQTVYRVRFDQAGNVIGVDKSGRELIAAVEPAHRKTPTLGRRRSFFDELFGNIGTVGAAGPSQGGSNGPY
jgi:outer membrane protein assembly factor BamE (lipoprotein component of BamABCDE complex)